MNNNRKLIETKAKEFFDLNEDDFLIENKYTEHEILEIKKSKIARTYSPIMGSYNDVIKETSNFVNNVVTTNNVLTINGAIAFLIWNGYISHNQKFYYTSTNYSHGGEFTNVILGSGCCRHIAGFVDDILKELDITSLLIANNLGDIKINDKFRLPITRNRDYIEENHTDEEEEQDISPLNPYFPNYLCNHLCIILPYKDYYLLYDPTGLLLFSLKGVKATCLFGRGNIIISPYDLIYRYGMTKEEIENYINSFSPTKRINCFEKKQVYKHLLEGVMLLKNNMKECEEFHKKIEEPMEYIYQYQYKLKNISKN